jgi:hypothetical protein
LKLSAILAQPKAAIALATCAKASAPHECCTWSALALSIWRRSTPICKVAISPTYISAGCFKTVSSAQAEVGFALASDTASVGGICSSPSKQNRRLPLLSHVGSNNVQQIDGNG